VNISVTKVSIVDPGKLLYCGGSQTVFCGSWGSHRFWS